MVGQGRARAAHFTWERTADLTMKVYQSMLNGSAARNQRSSEILMGTRK